MNTTNDPKTHTPFSGKRVLVTGAAQGIGLRIAERFVAAGADVIGLDVKIPASSGFRFETLDVSDPDAVSRVCQQLQQENDRLDVLVNAAGVLRTGNFETLSDEDWRLSMDVNAAGPFYMMRAWSAVFRRQRSGAIVNVASNAANLPRWGMMAYGASKAALLSLSHTVALELAPFGVRCNVVSPGSTDTPMLAGMLGDPAGQQRLIEGLPEQFKLGIPLRKIATPDDIADAVLFLASAQAGHITMQQLVVDGGATLAAS